MSKKLFVLILFIVILPFILMNITPGHFLSDCSCCSQNVVYKKRMNCLAEKACIATTCSVTSKSLVNIFLLNLAKLDFYK